MSLAHLPEAIANKIHWNKDGLIAAIAQSAEDSEVLMLAWMNAESLAKTIQTGEAHYWSRSRAKLWHKGEESGHIQTVVGMTLDCDGDAVLLKIQQKGVACHTGRKTCFFHELVSGEQPLKSATWKINRPIEVEMPAKS